MILYFSGTGNTAYVAKRLAEQTGDTALNLFDRIRKDDCTPLESETPWVLAVPTYAWRVPRLILSWLKRTELLGNRRFYLVMTYGSGKGAAADEMPEICRQKGLEYRGCAGLTMPENYIAMFRAPGREKALSIIAKAEPAIRKAAERIAQGMNLDTRKSTLPEKFLSRVVNDSFYRFSITAKPFRTTDACVACGKCAKICPMNNIHMDSGKPIWGDHCTHCMSCICRCPKEAIEYGKRTRGKIRYVCPKETEQ